LHSKIFVQIFEMGMNYQDEILYEDQGVEEGTQADCTGAGLPV
jgi:hypothetical protein